MNSANAALNLSDDLDYLFVEDYLDEDFMDDQWIEIAKQRRQRILAARRVALNFDDELQRQIDARLDTDQELDNLEDDDLMDMSLIIDDDDVLDLRTLADRPLY